MFIKNSAGGDISGKVVKYLHSISKSRCSRPQVSTLPSSCPPSLHLSDAPHWGPWTLSQASKQKLMPGSADHCFCLWLRSILIFWWVGAHVYWILGEFFQKNCLPSTHFHFKSLRNSSLRPLSGCSYPFGGLSSGSCRPVFSSRLSAPVFTGELSSLRGHLHAFRPPSQVAQT